MEANILQFLSLKMDFTKFFENFSNKNMETLPTLDKEILHFTLSLYNNPLISRKAVDGIIEMFDTFIPNFWIPLVQNQMKNELQCITSPDFILKQYSF